MTIPQIIISQIQSIDNWALSAYGSNNFYSIDESSEYQGGLGFSVNGLNHKGEVKILLKWIDVYEIQLLNNFSNESLVLLMELFGHSSMSITKRYLGIRQQEINDIYLSVSL